MSVWNPIQSQGLWDRLVTRLRATPAVWRRLPTWLTTGAQHTIVPDTLSR